MTDIKEYKKTEYLNYRLNSSCYVDKIDKERKQMVEYYYEMRCFHYDDDSKIDFEEFYKELGKIKKKIKNEKLFLKSALMYSDHDWYGNNDNKYTNVYIVSYRTENDEEYNKRIELEKGSINHKEKQERVILENLKKKYEKSTRTSK